MVRPNAKNFIKEWIFQGVGYESMTATIFKLLFESIMIMIGVTLLSNLKALNLPAVLLLLFLLHTLNWFINGSGLVKIMKIFNFKVLNACKVHDYLKSLRYHGSRKRYIDMIVIYGSFTRNDVHATSDLDVIIVRRKGSVNAIRSWLFGVRERTKAIFNLFPLDLSIIDNASDLKTKYIKCESPSILYDSGST